MFARTSSGHLGWVTKIGYFLASEEHGPHELVRQARLAEEAGFAGLWISDHFHPWIDEQGESPFVWAVIGALSQAVSLPVTTAVTCPIIRIHPVIIAQAAATAQVLLDGRFRLGVGTGEALNEHVVGAPWPPAGERLAMLEEAIGILRRLWTGEVVTHRGTYYDVDTARIYTLPDEPPPIYMSGFGPKAIALAARVADGYVSTAPDPEMVERFHKEGGRGKPAQAGLKVCWAEDEAEARRTAHRLWPNQGIPGEAAQLLPMPRHFEQLAALVAEEHVAQSVAYGPDPEAHVAMIRRYADAGFDEVYVSQIGPRQEEFFACYAEHVLPRFH